MSINSIKDVAVFANTERDVKEIVKMFVEKGFSDFWCSISPQSYYFINENDCIVYWHKLNGFDKVEVSLEIAQKI